MKNFLLLVALALYSPLLAQAFEEKDASEEAMAEVQALLKNPQVLEGPEGSPSEKAAMAAIKKITNGDAKAQAEINQVSSEIFTDMVKKNGSGEEAITKALQEAQKDPAKFMQSLSPEQQQKIRGLASEIDKKNELPPAQK